MTKDIKCFFGLHHYEQVNEEPIVNPYKVKIGVTYICRCTNCGKIKEFNIYTDSSYKL